MMHKAFKICLLFLILGVDEMDKDRIWSSVKINKIMSSHGAEYFKKVFNRREMHCLFSAVFKCTVVDFNKPIFTHSHLLKLLKSY